MCSVFGRDCSGLPSYLQGHLVQKYRVLIGAMFLGLSQATPWFYGNLMTYEYSYFKYHLGGADVYQKVVWIYPLYFAFLAIGIMTVDTLKKLTSLFITLILGCVHEDIGLFLSYFSVQHSVWTTMLTFCVYGYGQGVKLALGLVYAKLSFESKIGLTTSLVASTNGLGGIVFNAAITAFINPENLKPDTIDGNLSVFSQKKIISRFPSLFLILGGLTASIQIVAILLIGRYTRDQLNDKEKPQLCDSNYDLDVSQPKSIYGSLKSVQETLGNSSRSHSYMFVDRNHTVSNLEMKGNNTLTNQEYGERNPLSDLEVREDSTLTHATLLDKSPREALKSVSFYVLWLVMFSLCMGLVTVTSSFKLFSQMWIHDDNFLALVGSMNSVAVIVCRVGIGFVVDYIGVFSTINAMLAVNAAGISFWYFAVQPSRWLFLVWTCLLIGVQSTVFNVLPVATLKSFGPTYYVTNWGLLLTSLLIGSFVLPPLMARLVADIGWFWFFQFIGGVSVVSLVVFSVIILLHPDNVKKK